MRRNEAQASGGGGDLSQLLQSLRTMKAFATPADAAALTPLGLVQVAHPHQAAVYVKALRDDDSLQNAMDVNMWAAALRGSYLVVLDSKGIAAAVLKFKAVLRRATSIYTTASFRTKHKQFYDVLEACISSMGVWRMVCNRAAYGAGDARRSAVNFALICRKDRGRPELNAGFWVQGGWHTMGIGCGGSVGRGECVCGVVVVVF